MDGYYRKMQKTPPDAYVLSSFMEWWGGKSSPDFVRSPKHILDSGAYSVIADKTGKFKSNFSWDSYCADYIKFINENKIKLFFELDIDVAVGLKQVEYYRDKIHAETGVPPIPVWHPNRKEKYFWECAERYPYVSIGALGKSKTSPNMLALMTQFVKVAHDNGAKIHGLGFTAIKFLNRIHFDSVDSTTWNAARYGTLYKYVGGGKMEITYRDPSRRVKNHMAMQNYNFLQWVAYQNWALKHI